MLVVMIRVCRWEHRISRLVIERADCCTVGREGVWSAVIGEVDETRSVALESRWKKDSCTNE